MLEEILGQVMRPARYLGNEWNVVKKDTSAAEVKIALCFPDVYEVGMSHLGFRIIYGILNDRADTVCERVFTPWPDFSAELEKRDLALFTLESKTPLDKFDIVAFTLSYEMNYTNILEILRLGRIPLTSSRRGPEHPLIIGGGPCALNPEPLAAIFDLFVIGDGETVTNELIYAYRKIKSEDKTKRLAELSKIEGVYVPSLYKAPQTIKKRVVEDLDKSFYPTGYLVPYMSIIHDRVVVEIMRGCVHKCRFCQANMCYRPVRTRSKERILDLIKASYKNTGYEEFSLMSLSSGNYPNITGLIDEFSNLDILKEKGVAISLPSLRVEDVLKELPASVKRVKKTGLTFAPEAGTERLRKVISKEIDTKKLLEAIKAAQREGWRRVKLYFMIGLPTEDYSDIDGMLDLLHQISSLTRRGIFEIAVSISPFIPKAHTPFQWEKMAGRKELLEKQQYIRTRAKSGRIRLKFHKLNLSFMEAVFSRGDRRLGEVLLRAFEKGARFDSWDEFFNFDIWMEAFDKEGIDPLFYTGQRDFDDKLPWDHIDIGISKEWLIKEAKEAHTHHI